MMLFGGGVGLGPSCCSRILVFSVRQTSHTGIPACSLWQVCAIRQSIDGSFVAVVLISQYLLESDVPALCGVFQVLLVVVVPLFECIAGASKIDPLFRV